MLEGWKEKSGCTVERKSEKEPICLSREMRDERMEVLLAGGNLRARRCERVRR